MNHKPIRPAGRSVNDTILKRVARWLTTVAAVTAFAVLGAVFLLIVLEWLSGCGETYIDANGERHAHECIFLSYHK